MIHTFQWKNRKRIWPKKIMGLAIEGGSILAVDMRCDGERFHVERTAQMDFQEDISFHHPERLGGMLKQCIKENNFAAKKAVIGIPARWLMMREKNVPPSTSDSIAEILKIHAGREFSLDLEDLAIDYTGVVVPKDANRLFLIVMPRRNLDQVMETARFAGLDVLSITVSSIVLFATARAQMIPPFPRYFLYLRPDFAEFLVRSGEQTADVKYIQRNTKSGTASFISEVCRIISLYPKRLLEDEREQLLIWDASDQNENDSKNLRNAFSGQVEIRDDNEHTLFRRFGFTGEHSNPVFAAPAALCRADTRTDPFSVDFLHSRMSKRTGKIKRKHITSAAAIVMALIIFGLHMFFTWKRDKDDVAELRYRLAEMSADIKIAQNIVQKVTDAGRWYSKRPRILDCIRELTLIFPMEGRIWSTNLALNEEMRGIISGKAVDERSVIEVLDKMKENNLFSDVQMIYMRDNGKTAQEISFSMNFSFAHRD